MALPSRTFQSMQYVVTLLVLITLTLLLWHRYGMERVIELSAANPHEVIVYDDGAVPGALEHLPGHSFSTLTKSPHTLTMRCRLGQAFNWPYCKFRFVIGNGDKGVDLSEFDTVSLDLAYSGPAQRWAKLFVINADPGVPPNSGWRSTRFNEVDFEVPEQGVLTMPVTLLRTAEWWKGMAKVPLPETNTRIDNVTVVELSTSNIDLPAPEIVMELRSIRFHGKWISQDRLLLVLVWTWVLCGLAWMAFGILHFRASLAATNARLETVEAINKALELEARELAGQAHTDPLTGALNRQGLRETLLKRLQSTGHYSDGLAVIFVDLDFFKRINDQHGHEAGDDVLRRFAAMVRAHIRAADKLVRWGGEEFLLVCPETNVTQAAGLAEKLRAAMSLEAWPHALAVTASFGVAEIQPGEDIGAAITRADGALYRAKSGGRNRVETA